MKKVKIKVLGNPDPVEIDPSDIGSVGWLMKPEQDYMTLSMRDNTQLVCEYSKEIALELFGEEELP